MKKHWMGLIETFLEADAETEEEALKIMTEELIKDLQSGEREIITWED